MRKKFIVIEGVDGSGKSEAGRIVSNMLGALYIESPLPEFKLVREYIDEYSSPVGRFLFYLSTNLDLSRVIKNNLESQDVICARYYYSTVVGYSARSGSSVDDLFNVLPISDKDFHQPDLTILLYVNRDEQKNRINKRNKGINSGSDELCLHNDNYGKELAEKYLMTAKRMNWTIIDTSNITLEDVAKECLASIQRLK